jgi:hypothetical protein
MTLPPEPAEAPGSPVPWKRVQGYRIDLDRVELVYQQPGDERSVTVTMITGATVNLSGEDAAQFLRSFDAYRAVQEIGRDEPGPDSHEIARGPQGPTYGHGKPLVDPGAGPPGDHAGPSAQADGLTPEDHPEDRPAARRDPALGRAQSSVAGRIPVE